MKSNLTFKMLQIMVKERLSFACMQQTSKFYLKGSLQGGISLTIQVYDLSQ